MISPAKLLIYRMTHNSSKYSWRPLVLFLIFILDVINDVPTVVGITTAGQVSLVAYDKPTKTNIRLFFLNI